MLMLGRENNLTIELALGFVSEESTVNTECEFVTQMRDKFAKFYGDVREK